MAAASAAAWVVASVAASNHTRYKKKYNWGLSPIVLFLALISLPVSAQEDSIHIFLDEVTLTEHRNLSAISGTMAGGIRIDSKLMQTYPKMFGYTDPVRYLQSLPGVSTNADMAGGLHVQGGEISHNIVMVSDVPVYGSMNFTGLFSLFNQDHLPTVEFSTTTKSPFLGAELGLDHADTIPKRLSGTATLGPITAQATLNAPLSGSTALMLSVRRSFINTFYSGLMQYDGNPLRFGFTDANLTLLQPINALNTLDLNMLWNHDVGGCGYGTLRTAMDCWWGNKLASLRWRHTGQIKSSTSLFVTNYALNGSVNDGVNSGHMPAHMTHAALKTEIKLPYAFTVDADANYYDILPQDPHIDNNLSGTASQPRQEALLGNIYLSRLFKIGRGLEITPHLLASAYTERGQYECFNADPTLTVGYDMFRKGMITLETGMKHQYIVQTGMTNVGLPIEFWVAAGRYFEPQKSVFATLSYDLQFAQSKYALSVQAYGKRLYNQAEYTGFIYDMLTHPYSLESNLLICNGFNYGVNMMLAKQAGKVTGWLSYSYGQSLREGDGVLFPKVFHSSHERSHEFNAVLSYKTGRWDLGANYIMASGNPYTPAKNLYVLANTLVIYYDEYNSANLPLYLRLDLSATYNLPSHGRYDHNVNVSLFNATAHENYMLGYIKADEEKMTIRYKLAKILIPIIPSISYTCRF